VLRAWACQVLLRKICGRAKRRRAAQRALRCWEAWKLYIRSRRQERQLSEWAETYFEQVVHLRRVLFAWRNCALAERHARRERLASEDVRVLGRAFYAWRQRVCVARASRLGRTFAAWRLHLARVNKARMERYEARYLLMPTNRTNVLGAFAVRSAKK
jgi:hypothetical protein